MLIKKGSIFLVTEGAYSDYQTDMLCKAITDIDVMALQSEYLALYPKQSKDFSFDEYQFCEWLVDDKKVCKMLEYSEWHLGDYSEIDFSVNYHKAIGGTR